MLKLVAELGDSDRLLKSRRRKVMTYFRKFTVAAMLALGAITVAATGIAVTTEQAEALFKVR
jgi:hypothetical protein